MDLLRVALMVPFQTDMYDMFTLLTPLAGTIELKGRMRGREYSSLALHYDDLIICESCNNLISQK